MTQATYRKIIDLVQKAAELARSIGIPNILQPGLVKEMIIADILGHELIHSKRDADAHAVGRPDEKYEYLSCTEGGTGQLDRMFKEPAEKRAASMRRITRNKKIYYAVFYKDNQMRCKTAYEISPDIVAAEAERQLDRSSNVISHIAFSESWVQANGAAVYQDSNYGTHRG